MAPVSLTVTAMPGVVHLLIFSGNMSKNGGSSHDENGCSAFEGDSHWRGRYLHVNAFLTKHYSLSENSIFAYMTGEEEEQGDIVFIEEFQDLEQAKYSEYGVFYEMADRIIEELGHWR